MVAAASSVTNTAAAHPSQAKMQQHQQQQHHHQKLSQKILPKSQCQKNQAFTDSRSTSKESISLHSPPPIRSMSAPLPMSKAARKAFLAAKQTKAIEKLDKMIEEVTESEQQMKASHSMRVHDVFGDRIQGQVQGHGDDDMDMAGGCPLFLPPPPRHMANSISDSNICSHG